MNTVHEAQHTALPPTAEYNGPSENDCLIEEICPEQESGPVDAVKIFEVAPEEGPGIDQLEGQGGPGEGHPGVIKLVVTGYQGEKYQKNQTYDGKGNEAVFPESGDFFSGNFNERIGQECPDYNSQGTEIVFVPHINVVHTFLHLRGELFRESLCDCGYSHAEHHQQDCESL